MSNFETALHLLPSFLVVMQKFQILTSTPFFRALWKETSFVASRGRAGGDEEQRGLIDWWRFRYFFEVSFIVFK